MPHVKDLSHKKSSTSSKVTERPKVSFGPYVEKHRPAPGKQDVPKQTRHVAKGHFTPNPGTELNIYIQNHPLTEVTHIHKYQMLFYYCVDELYIFLKYFFQIKVSVFVLHSLTSDLPVHIVLV